jgi:hypothetical protein
MLGQTLPFFSENSALALSSFLATEFSLQRKGCVGYIYGFGPDVKVHVEPADVTTHEGYSGRVVYVERFTVSLDLGMVTLRPCLPYFGFTKVDEISMQ